MCVGRRSAVGGSLGTPWTSPPGPSPAPGRDTLSLAPGTEREAHTLLEIHTGLDSCRSRDAGVSLGLHVPQLIIHPSAVTELSTMKTNLFNRVKQRLKINITKEKLQTLFISFFLL